MSALPDALRLGPVSIAVADVERSVAFYQRSIGLGVQHREAGRAELGTGGEDILVLVQEPGAKPPGHHAGLYHFALLHPSRQELARAARRLIDTATPLSGASDHGISEAIYLPDPDGNGIELAADRGRERWGDLRDPATIGPRPLDMESLLAQDGGSDREGASPDLVVGHVHLHVGDVERGLSFYRDTIGFEVMTRFPTAAFVAAGGYHHHLAFNTWRGVDVPPAPSGVAGLREWTVVLPEGDDLDQLRARLRARDVQPAEDDRGLTVRDPWGHPLRLTVERG